ncbi:toxin-antitoxin system YwqK family antitoxin [Fusobacterium animalis]|uniref:toxin-antitoxin system YwqK family antitoxin n=1 Tax=Fusobacterium animalis TaxID=76859 RepID=UPI001C6EA6BB|nr:toxin-antitoxin system YwqK family antitoxin [Fusobacterium animalis]QYR68744.1 toxin-antitoxin system YwqK family antitoxin [Fusobacterium animalis]
MKRKNFILIVLMFLFINILSMAVENPTTISDSISVVDPAFQEALKDYKPNLENIDKIFDYIEKNIKEKGRAIFYSKLEKGKNVVIVTDENNNIIYTEILPEKLIKIIPYFEAKEIYQLKNGKTLSYMDYSTEMVGKNVTIKSENLLKKKMNKKEAIEVLNKLRDSNSFTKNNISNIEYAKSECYDEEGNLLFTMKIKDNKVITEAQKNINGKIIKMIYIVNDVDTNSGLIETYLDGKLAGIMQMKNFFPEDEAKMFYPSGKLLSISTFKNGKMDGIVKMYYENGKIGVVYNMKDGIQGGEAIAYDENGNVVEKVLYKNGKIVR